MDTSWKVLLEDARQEVGDVTPIVACTLSDADMLVKFDSSYGISKGVPFTAWSETRVYFPAVYDGMEWVASVPRNPCSEATTHVGGE